MKWVKLIPRVDADLGFVNLGAKFVVLLVKDSDDYINIYAKTPVFESLKDRFDVMDEEPDYPLKEFYVAKAQCRRKSDVYHFNFICEDPPSLIAEAEPLHGIAFSVALDTRLRKIMVYEYKHAKEKEARFRMKVLRGESIFDEMADSLAGDAFPRYLEELRSKIEEPLYLVEPYTFGPSKKSIKTLIQFADSLMYPVPKWNITKVKSWTDFLKILEPPKITLFKQFADAFDLIGYITDYIGWGIKTLNTTKSQLERWFRLPDPKKHRIRFSRGLSIPALTSSEDGIKIGVTEDGEVIHIRRKDIFQHIYVIGKTRSGKSTFLRLLTHRIKELIPDCAIIVIDPHGDLAERLAKEIPDSLFLHPFKSPFGVNPLELPKGITREHAISIGMNSIVELFTNVLELPETAHYVKYVLRLGMNVIYQKTDKPTFSIFDEVIRRIRQGEEILVDDPTLKKNLDRIRDLPIETLISTFSRLFRFAGDPILRRITSTTTVPFDEIIRPGKVTLFSLPTVELTKENTNLLASAILLKIWFEVQARARLGKPRTPVFVIVDEFENLQGLETIETILAEARKFGLYLVVAHQHTKQLDSVILQSVLTNTGIKVVFCVEGDDIDVFRRIDPSFAREIESIVVNLPCGHALLKVSVFDGTPPPPVVVKIDYPDYNEVRGDEDICTEKYKPPSDVQIDEDLLAEIFNPILKFIDRPMVVEQLILYQLYLNGGELRGADLQYKLALERGVIDRALLNLRGKIEVQSHPKKGRIIRLVRDFFEDFTKVSPSERGRVLIERAVKYYLEKGYYVAPVKQRPGVQRPDLIAIPLTGLTPDYRNAIAVEIEAHPDRNIKQVVRNLTKDCTKYFKDVHIWTFDIYKSLFDEIAKDVKVFYVESVLDMESDTKQTDDDIEAIRQEILEVSSSPSEVEDISTSIQGRTAVSGKLFEVLSTLESESMDEEKESDVEKTLPRESREGSSSESEEVCIKLPDGHEILVFDQDKAKKIRQYLSEGYRCGVRRKGKDGKIRTLTFYDQWDNVIASFNVVVLRSPEDS